MKTWEKLIRSVGKNLGRGCKSIRGHDYKKLRENIYLKEDLTVPSSE
jgi:hypothetical protein